MQEHFLKWINIVNFKCFQNFEAKNFGRVNLIGAKNNVGKTAFMEACYLNVQAIDIDNFGSSLILIKTMREHLNLLHKAADIHKQNLADEVLLYIEYADSIELESNINNASFQIERKAGQKFYDFNINQQRIKVNINDFSCSIKNMGNIVFIDSYGFANGDIIEYYSAVQKQDKEDFLNVVLNEFDGSIESFKIFDKLPQCKVNGKWLEITELGDGTRHIISLITALFKCENGYLFVDELENGIHYTYLEKTWETILKLSKELNVQVFATTHSKECIEAYTRAAQKLEDRDIAFIRLSRLNDGEIKASTLDYELLENSMEQNHEVRGW